ERALRERVGRPCGKRRSPAPRRELCNDRSPRRQLRSDQRAELSLEQAALGTAVLVAQRALEIAACSVDRAERCVQLCVCGERERIAIDERALGDRIELVEARARTV